LGCDTTNISHSFLPEGTAISLHTYTIHRDPRYFSPHPDSFWPDRWLEPENRRSLGDLTQPYSPIDRSEFVLKKTAFVPFSSGPRNCVGKSLATNEMRAVVSAVVQRFDMEVAPGYDLDEWEGTLADWFLLLKNGDLPVILKER
jgi:cytochrome P450